MLFEFEVKTKVRRLIGVFLGLIVFKVNFSSRVQRYGLRLWSCIGRGGGQSSRLSGLTKILT